MAKFELRKKAQILRSQGLSIKEIAEKLCISKSSASIWCRDLQLTPTQEKHLREKMVQAGHKGRMVGAERNKKMKEERIKKNVDKARNDLGRLSERDLLIAGIGLYWGEGRKDGDFTFSNSDPKMILFIHRWLVEFVNVNKDDIYVRVLINETHRKRIEVVERFWISLLKLKSNQIRNTTFIKSVSKKTYTNHDSYFGTLKLRVRKSSNLLYYTRGLIDALKEKATTPA